MSASSLRASLRAEVASLAAVPHRWLQRSSFAMATTAALVLAGTSATAAHAAGPQPPTTPGTLSRTLTDFGVATLQWGASSDDDGVTAYDVIDAGVVVKTVDGSTTQTTFTWNARGPIGPGGPGQPASSHPLTVVAKDAAGNVSTPSNTVVIGTCYLGIPTSGPVPNLVVTGTTDTTVSLSWSPATPQNECQGATTSYSLRVDGDNAANYSTTPADQTTSTITGLHAGTKYKATVNGRPDSGFGATPATTTFTTSGTLDHTPPSKPTGVTVERNANLDGITSVSWQASTDDTGVARYEVYTGTQLSGGTASDETSAELSPDDTAHDPSLPVSVVAIDFAGNRTASDPLAVNTCGIVIPPHVNLPSAPVVSAVTATTATISWQPSPTGGCSPVPTDHYDVYLFGDDLGEHVVGTVGADRTSFVVTGLKPGTEYGGYPAAVAASPDVPSQRAQGLVTFTTLLSDPVDLSSTYTASGSATLKNLVKGAIPLSGQAKSTYRPSTGAFTADLTLGKSTAALKAFGFLPVTAVVAFVPTEAVTGTITGTTLAATAKVRIKLPSIRAFGMQIAGGPACQTSKISSIPLVSGSFTPAAGGTLTGTFPIGNLSGCGALNDFVNSLTGGPGNVIALKLAPLPAPTA